MKNYVKLFCASIFAFFFTVTIINATLNQHKADEIVSQKVKELFCLINENWTYAEYDNEYYTESEYWKPIIVDGPDFKYVTLKLINHRCNVIEALRDLPTKKARLECATVFSLVKSLCLLELMGENNFNIWLKDLSKYQYKPSEDGFFNSIQGVFYAEKQAEESGFYYIHNHPSYNKLKPSGNAAGYNGFLFPDQTFITFDPHHFIEPKSIEDTQRILFNDLLSYEHVYNHDLHTIFKIQYGSDNGFNKILETCLAKKQASEKPFNFDANRINRYLKKGVSVLY